MKEVIYVPVVLGATWLKVFAQSGGTTVDPGLGTLIGNIGIMGVLVWYLWYDTTKSRPKMLDKFGEEQEKIRTAFAAEQHALRMAFATEQAALRDANAKETRELREMLIETMRSMRTAVHDVKDTAQVAITQTAAADARERQQRNTEGKG